MRPEQRVPLEERVIERTRYWPPTAKQRLAIIILVAYVAGFVTSLVLTIIGWE